VAQGWGLKAVECSFSSCGACVEKTTLGLLPAYRSSARTIEVHHRFLISRWSQMNRTELEEESEKLVRTSALEQRCAERRKDNDMAMSTSASCLLASCKNIERLDSFEVVTSGLCASASAHARDH
jgi:hypothetical protein